MGNARAANPETDGRERTSEPHQTDGSEKLSETYEHSDTPKGFKANEPL